jgi:NADH dehydrogenase FAD-containing subunit
MDAFDVVILGAGYAGVTCALRLVGRTKKLRIALVSQKGLFVERLRLHEELAKPGFVLPARLPRLDKFLEGSGCTFIQGKVAAIDRVARLVRVDTGDGIGRVSYRFLVVALGSHIATSVPGADEHAYVLDAEGPHGQPALKQRLATLDLPAPHIIVVGGGATGIEVAAELTRVRGAHVTILDAGDFAGFAKPPVRRRLVEAVGRAGVAIRERVRVETVAADHVVTNIGEVRCDLCIWCAGFAAQPVALDSGLATGPAGRIRVDPYLRSLTDSSVFAAGDACVPVEWCGAPPRMSAFFALTTGAHVADTIARMHADKRARPFGFWTYGQAIAVGEEAVGFATIPYDRQAGPVYRGRTAFRLRSFFVWVLVRLIGLQRRFPFLPFWLGRSAYRRTDVRRYMPPSLTDAEASPP